MAHRVFVLRPEPGLSATMERGRGMGLPMVALPMSYAAPVVWPVPDGRFDGILLGSANGLRHAGHALVKFAKLPVYAVGEATARAARARGFTVARTGNGGLQALVDDLADDPPLSLLRLAGAEAMALDSPANISVHNVTTYRIVHRGLSERDRSELSKGGIVLLHSGAAARHFALECERAGLARAHLSLAALAPRIAASAGDGWKSVAVAASPDDAALLSLAADMCH